MFVKAISCNGSMGSSESVTDDFGEQRSMTGPVMAIRYSCQNQQAITKVKPKHNNP